MLTPNHRQSFARKLLTGMTLAATLTLSVACKNNRTDGAQQNAESATPDISRIVSINGAMTEILVEFGLIENIIGVDISSTWPMEIRQYPQVGYYRNLSDEGVIGLNPTIIIGEQEAGPAAVVDRLRSSGIPVRLIEFEISLEGAIRRIQDVADAVGLPEKGEELIARVNAELEEALQVPGPASAEPPKILGVYARGAGLSLVSGYGTPYDIVIGLVGGQNAVKEFETFQPMTPEAVATSEADVILITEGGLAALGGIEGLLAVNGISMTPAGKHRRILAYDDLLLTGLGPRLPQLVRDIRTQLHEFFPPEAPSTETTPE